jgi:hypothetical protein
MSDAAAAPAVVQQGEGEVQQQQPTPTEQKPQPTREEVIATIRAGQEKSMAEMDRAIRLAKARRGYRVELTHEDGRPYTEKYVLGPSIEPTDEELRAMVPLPQDRFDFGWENKAKGTKGTIALNAHGLISSGRPTGPRKPHMSKRKMAVHNASLRIYKTLFAEAARAADVQAKKDNKPYVGIPEEDLKKLGFKALQLGAREVFRSIKAAQRYNRRVQDANRRVNTGLLPGNQVNGVIRRGGQFGR